MPSHSLRWFDKLTTGLLRLTVRGHVEPVEICAKGSLT